jgi:hypothetical protein
MPARRREPWRLFRRDPALAASSERVRKNLLDLFDSGMLQLFEFEPLSFH